MKTPRTIPPLPAPHSHHLRAAEGWLELGNYLEANAELDEIAPQLRAHPAVLNQRWQIYAEAKRWDAALELANTLVQLLPDDVHNWLQRSLCLQALKRTREARDSLLPATIRFPEDRDIRYDLATYECQLGNLAEAKRWLAECFALPNAAQLKLSALSDPNFEPLWQHIGEL